MSAAEFSQPAAPGHRTGALERLLSLGWSAIESTCRQLLSLAFFFATVRFLHPSDLGIFVLALALYCVAGVFIDEPIGEALVQKADITLDDWNTGFTVNLVIAAIALGIAAAISPLLAIGFHEPALAYAVPALGIGAMFGALGNIQKAYLSRALRFRAIAQITLVSQVVGGACTLALAVLGYGYWALIGGVVFPAIFGSALYWIVSPWKPRLRLNRETIASRRPYATYSILVRSVYLIRDQAPLIIAGMVLNVSMVGFLSLAMRVTRSLSQLFEEVTSRPLLSLISREQHDLAAFGRVLLQVLTIIGALALPAFVGLTMIGPRLVPLVFGPGWAPTAALLPYVCVALGGSVVLHMIAVSLRARDLGRYAVYLTVPATAADVVIFATLMPISLQWALAGWAIRAVLTIPVAVWVLRHHLGVGVRPLLDRWVPPAIASALMAAVLYGVEAGQYTGTGLPGLIGAIALGAGVYLATLALCAHSLLRQAIAALRARGKTA